MIEYNWKLSDWHNFEAGSTQTIFFSSCSPKQRSKLPHFKFENKTFITISSYENRYNYLEFSDWTWAISKRPKKIIIEKSSRSIVQIAFLFELKIWAERLNHSFEDAVGEVMESNKFPFFLKFQNESWISRIIRVPYQCSFLSIWFAKGLCPWVRHVEHIFLRKCTIANKHARNQLKYSPRSARFLKGSILCVFLLILNKWIRLFLLSSPNIFLFFWPTILHSSWYFWNLFRISTFSTYPTYFVESYVSWIQMYAF